MDTFLLKVENTVRCHGLLAKGDTVLVALSGGADSVALLHALLALKEPLELAEIRAVHVNHGIRGDNADRDERFVRALCAQCGVVLSVGKVDVPLTVRSTGESIEEAARRLRYTYLEDVASCVPNAKIATAHSLDDQAETILFRLVRGCGLKGAAGMPISRERIIRPLLECTAQEIRSYCAENGFAYIVDETNADRSYARNRLRLETLNSLRAVNSRATQNLVRFAAIAREEDRFLDSLCEQLLESAYVCENTYRVKELLQADAVLRRRALCRICNAEYEHISKLDAVLSQGGTVNLPGDRSAVSDGTTLRVVQHSRVKNTAEDFRTNVIIGDVLDFAGHLYRPQLISSMDFRKIQKIHKNLFDFCVSYDMIEGDLVLRSRQPGDRIRPYKRGCTKDIKKLMNDWHIPCEKRSRIPVLVSGCHILSLVGFCVDEAVAVNDTSEQILWLEPLSECEKPTADS